MSHSGEGYWNNRCHRLYNNTKKQHQSTFSLVVMCQRETCVLWPKVFEAWDGEDANMTLGLGGFQGHELCMRGYVF